jgi:hypothetical protein
VDRSSVHLTVVLQRRCTFDTKRVTGRQIKEQAVAPADFALFRRVRGGNEPVPDDVEVEVRDGDHFFARPPASQRLDDDPQMHRRR